MTIYSLTNKLPPIIAIPLMILLFIGSALVWVFTWGKIKDSIEHFIEEDDWQ